MAGKRRGDIIARLRQRIVTAFHLGLISAGDRLPSSRRLAREFRANERVILAAYRALASEGLVEFRPRSGVYLSSRMAPEAPVFPGLADWALDILANGLAHGIPAVELPRLLARLLRTVRLRAACIECNDDHLDTLCGEMSRDYGLICTPVDLDKLHRPATTKALRAADVLVTTSFHADVVGALAERLGKPCIAVSWRPDVMAEVARLLRTRPVYFVGTDPRFAEKLRLLFPSRAARANVRLLLAGDADIASIPSATPIYLTTLARKTLGSAADRLHAVPLGRLLVPESARAVLGLVIRSNLSALDGLANGESLRDPSRSALDS
jgi:DNA-binding transcriptional regulator YhcF (GntR family)